MNPSTPQAPLQARALTWQTPGGTTLAGFDADFAPGLTLLVDAEGEAKTPLLHLLAGERAPSAGTVRWRGQDIRALPAAERAAQVFWRDPRAPWPEITPVQWARELAARYAGWRPLDWAAHLAGLGLVEHQDKEMFRLSTGSQRKVLLAAALASGAPLTLIDEPEAALDWASTTCLRQALARLADSGRVIAVAHYEPVPGVPWGQQLHLG